MKITPSNHAEIGECSILVAKGDRAGSDFCEVEYRVRPVTRYIVTRYEDGPGSPGVSTATGADYLSYDTAYAVAFALAGQEDGWIRRADPGKPMNEEEAKVIVQAALSDSDFRTLTSRP